MTIPARIYNRVLVPLDGSTAAEFAIRFGADLASKHGAELILLYLEYLTAQPDSAPGSEAEGKPLDEIETYLTDLRKDARAAGIPIRHDIIKTRNLHEALFKYLDSEAISIVVMSTQGRVPMLRWLFGSSIEKTLESLPVPVLLVRPMYQHIVVPLDGSSWSESAIPRATELARVHDAELVLLHVYQSTSGDYAGQWALAGQQQIADQGYEQMQAQLIAVRNRLRAQGLRAREVLLRGNNPAQMISEFVESQDGISMVVMTTHGRTGLARWLVGSVAQQVLKKARCPVMLVNPD